MDDLKNPTNIIKDEEVEARVTKIESAIEEVVSFGTMGVSEELVPMEAGDDDFCAYFEFVEQFAIRVSKDPKEAEMLLELIKLYKKRGVLNLSELIKDEILSVGKENKKAIPISSYHERKGDLLLVGQIDTNGKLNGIGRKITPWAIIEGQFEENLLKGFGREIRFDIYNDHL